MIDIENIAHEIQDRAMDFSCPVRLDWDQAMYIARALHSRGYLGWAPEWQPIETIPNDRRILCTNGLEEHVCIQYANGVFSHGCYIPTHWMPLPKPPEETK